MGESIMNSVLPGIILRSLRRAIMIAVAYTGIHFYLEKESFLPFAVSLLLLSLVIVAEMVHGYYGRFRWDH